MTTFDEAPIELFEHQKEAVIEVLKHKKFGVFFECGTGKTYIGLEVVRQLKKKTLIIVPPNDIYNDWKDEIKFYLDDSYDVTLTTPGKMIRRKHYIDEGFEVVIFDEAHKAKGKTTKTSLMTEKICNKAEYVVGLTGTPTANQLLDVYWIYKHLGIQAFSQTYKDFLDEYCNYYLEKNRYTGARYYAGVEIRPKSRNDVKNKMHTKCMIKKQSECLDLPETNLKEIFVKGMSSDFDKDLKDGIIEYADGTKDTMITLVKYQKRHQCAQGFVYGLNPGDKLAYNVDWKKNKKIKKLEKLLEDILHETDTVTIVYKYKKDLENITNMLKSTDYSYTSDYSEFKENNTQIFLRQFQRAEGINIQHVCNTMVFYSYGYSYLAHRQMKKRIHRNGQKNGCNYYVMISKGTIDEAVWDAIKHKKSEAMFFKSIEGV